MNSISLHKNFISPSECNCLLEYAKSNFEIDKRTYTIDWHASTNRNSKFQNKVKEIIRGISPFFPFHITWINLTEYENGRDLELHYDERSNFTFTILLTENFSGGDFIIEQDIFTLEKGDCIAFDGQNLLHGVSPVTEGYRAALNVWVKPGNTPLL